MRLPLRGNVLDVHDGRGAADDAMLLVIDDFLRSDERHASLECSVL